MSILDRMQERNDMKKRVLEEATRLNLDPEVVFKGLQLKRKNPRVNQILGDSNPFAAEDLEDLREFMKISRGSV